MNFLPTDEVALAEEFISSGRIIRPVDDREALDRIQSCAAALAAEHLDMATPADAGAFLDAIHDHVDPDTLNPLRLAVIEGLNCESWLRPSYFALARKTIELVVGNELCMQRRVNLSVQMPNDDSSLLGTHADTWSGDSPFEVVVWLPLVDCHRTKSMYLCPPDANADVQARLATFASAEDIFGAIETHVEWLSIPYGSVVVFNHNLMHGNRINLENETRWSMNCRFKAVLSPYADKKLGEFFEPITLKPATRVGAAFKLPEGYQ